MVTIVYCVNSPRKALLFDISSNVNITPNKNNFQEGTVMDVSDRKLKINTGGGPVWALKIGFSTEWVVRPNTERLPIYMAKTLYVKDFLVKIMFGERWYLTRSYISKNNLMNKLGKAVTTLNMPKKRFYL